MNVDRLDPKGLCDQPQPPNPNHVYTSPAPLRLLNARLHVHSQGSLQKSWVGAKGLWKGDVATLTSHSPLTATTPCARSLHVHLQGSLRKA